MTIIDVRSKPEFDQQHVEGAEWFDVMRFANGELPDVAKDEEVVLYCYTGARSNTAAQIMQANGFSKAVSGGGLAHMAARGYKLVRG
ncbi:MAG TPA: rhodanese-like domain-containing protein [Candidatus Saccharimonadales bacterium]|nr:rhodanese-like domain-containing protein [Candidatus Saccharimonadales bacterium]